MELLTIAVFVGALATIALDWADRTKLALGAAGVVVLLGAIDQEGAIEAIDWATLGLLFGMMVVVVLAEPTGIFGYVGLAVARASRGRPVRLLFLLAGLTSVLSAFLDNLTAILLVVPVAFTAARRLDVSPVPLVLTQIVASNVGGTATLIGDPPNIMIGGHVEELTFVDFIVNLAPVAIVTVVATTGLLAVFFRNGLRVDPSRVDALDALEPRSELRSSPRHRAVVIGILLATVLLFFTHTLVHVEPAVVALLGASAMLAVSGTELEHALAKVEWATLLFFVGLFVVVGALEEQGTIDRVAEWLGDVTGGSRTGEALVILWGAAAGSALVDNIPFTAAMIPVVDALEGGNFDDTLWWALALGACFGGNATMIAAAANVAATGVLRREGHSVSFGRFLAMGVPVTLLSLAIATAYMLVFQL
jgi:Na+/H+ antiporter NhaD/arsenite permease-like protein